MRVTQQDTASQNCTETLHDKSRNCMSFWRWRDSGPKKRISETDLCTYRCSIYICNIFVSVSAPDKDRDICNSIWRNSYALHMLIAARIVAVYYWLP